MAFFKSTRALIAVADLGEVLGGPENPLIWLKKISQKEEKPAEQAKQTAPLLAQGLGPPLHCHCIFNVS